jgi:putative DNA methylase
MSSEKLVAEDVSSSSAIENDFPYQQLNHLAALEAYNKHHYRPTNYQHKWWARRLGSVFRTLNIAALSDTNVTADETWKKVTETCDFSDAVIFDPFMGGGTTGQEATRVGAKFVGSDLNSVAWFITRMGLAPQSSMLETYFRRVMNLSRDEIQPYYRTQCPSCGEAVGSQFYLWVRLVDQDDGQYVREYDTLVVDHDRDGSATVVCPECHGISGVDDPTEAICGKCDHSFDATAEDVRVAIDSPNSVFNGGERPAYEPYAVKYDCKDCDVNGFSEFGDFDIGRLQAARERFEEIKETLPLPTQDIPEGGEKTRDLHNRNYTEWMHLFNNRQLLALGTLLKNIKQVDNELARHYLTLTFSATLEFNNMFCSYKGADPHGPGAVRHIFSHHAYVHPGEPLENNPIGTRGRQSGTFRYLYEYRLKKALDYQHNPIERVLSDDETVKEKKSITGEQIGGKPAASIDELLTEDKTHFINCGDSADLPFTEELADEVDAVITDPPYYDSVQYSELADFFYVWQKQSLEQDFPDIFARDTVVSEAEAVGNRTRKKSLDDYRQLLQNVFESSFNLLKEDGVLAFTFHHKQPEAWGAVLEAISGAGFRVVNTYPVRGENRLSVHIKGQRAVLLDSVIVCRKDHKKSEEVWDAVYGEIKRKTRERIHSFHELEDDDLSRLDASVVAYGICMTEYSKFETVARDDGVVVSERDAMDRIQPLIDDLNAEEF